MTISDQLPTGWVPDEDFADRLARVRRTLRLDLREAAELCGLNYRTWQTWEDGRRPQDMLDVVEKISEGLGVDRNWLAWGEVDPGHQPPRLSREHGTAGDEPHSGSDIDQFLAVVEAAEASHAA